MSAGADARPGAGGDVARLVEMVRAVDPRALAAARAAGPAAVPALASLRAEPDHEVRHLAAFCLVEAGGEAAVAPLVLFLDDDLPRVRRAALDGLLRHAGPGATDVLGPLLRFHDERATADERRLAALVAGRVASGGAVDVAPLRARYEAEKDPEAREGWTAVLASLGDERARKAFADGLLAAREQRLARFLRDYARAIHQPWLLKPLRPVLARREAVAFRGHGLDPEALRGCDVAIPLVASISGRRFSFPTDGPRRFTDEQIDEVASYLSRLPPEPGGAAAGGGQP